MRAAIYCRISDDRTGEQAGVKRQEQDCRRFCEGRNWKIVEVFTDNDLSAYKRKRRPAYRAMIEAIKAAEVNAVVVWHLDRLYRHPLELEELIELVEETGLAVATVTGGDYDLTMSDGRAMARVVVAFARKESEDKSRRTQRKHLELAQAGAAVGGGRPFGYELDRTTINNVEAELVREAARRILAGESLRGVCIDWNERGVRTTKGGRWDGSGLRRTLTAARIAGLRSHGVDGPVIAPGQWPAIVDEATRQRLRALLLDPARRVNHGYGPRRYLLTGLLNCGLCGTRLIARAHGPRKRCYVCAAGPGPNGCGKLRIVAEPLEELVAEMIFEALDAPAMNRAIARNTELDDDQALLDAIATEEAQLEQLARDHYAERVIGRGEYLAARQAVEHRLEAARKRLVRNAQCASRNALAGEGASLRQRWDAMSLHQRRAVCETLLERIDVAPAKPGQNRWNPERVRPDAVRWRV